MLKSLENHFCFLFGIRGWRCDESDYFGVEPCTWPKIRHGTRCRDWATCAITVAAHAEHHGVHPAERLWGQGAPWGRQGTWGRRAVNVRRERARNMMQSTFESTCRSISSSKKYATNGAPCETKACVVRSNMRRRSRQGNMVESPRSRVFKQFEHTNSFCKTVGPGITSHMYHNYFRAP